MRDASPKSTSAELNRRTVLTTAAWSVPVVAAAAVTPLAAATTTNRFRVVSGTWEFVEARVDEGWVHQICLPTSIYIQTENGAAGNGEVTIGHLFDRRMFEGVSFTVDGVTMPASFEGPADDSTHEALTTRTLVIPAGGTAVVGLSFERFSPTQLAPGLGGNPPSRHFTSASYAHDRSGRYFFPNPDPVRS